MGIRRSGRREAVRLLHVHSTGASSPIPPRPHTAHLFSSAHSQLFFRRSIYTAPSHYPFFVPKALSGVQSDSRVLYHAHLTHHATIQIASPMSRKPKNKGSSTGRSYETLMGLNIDNRGSHQSTSNGLSSGYRSQIETETGQLMSCRAEINCPMPWTNSDG